MRRTVTITNNSKTVPLAIYRTVCLVIDHASLVSSKRSRADARDIRISKDGVYRQVHVRFPNTAATEVYWSLDAKLIAASSRTYTLHIGALDDKRDEHPIPMRSKSQWDVEQATPAFRDVRTQPFAYYDGFRDGYANGELYPLTSAPGTPSTALYDSAMTSSWGQAAVGVVTAVSGAGNLSLTWERFTSSGPVRVRGTALLQSGFTVPAAGVIAKGAAGALTGYTSGVGTAANAGFIGEVTGGAFGATAATALTRFVTDMTFPVEVGYDGTTVTGSIDGQAPTGFSDSAHAGKSRAGIWSATTGALGGIAFTEAWAEVWDGVDDSDVSVSVADLTATLPCPAAPGISEALIRPAASNPSEEFAAVRSQARGPQDLPQYDLTWPLMSQCDYWELRALWHAQKGGAGTFSWAPPKGTSETFRFVRDSLRATKTAPGGYSARVTVERALQ